MQTRDERPEQCSYMSSVEAPGFGWDERYQMYRCEADGEVVRLETPQGRPDAIGGPYCSAHGGRERADVEAHRCWDYLAPACVGDAGAVREAGAMQLGTEHAYVVIREQSPGEGGGWRPAIGLGSHTRILAGRYPEHETAIYASTGTHRRENGHYARSIKWQKQAGVPGVHPHRLRHTAATLYLRGGGDALSLQKLLGHSSLEMVKRYVALSDTDLAVKHRAASPGDRFAECVRPTSGRRRLQ